MMAATVVITVGASAAKATWADIQAPRQTGATPQTRSVKGLSLTPRALARARVVSLQDCPPGANTQRGVIRPTENSEFVTVTVDIEVGDDFDGATIARPSLVDRAGKKYGTAQSFTDLGSAPTHTCAFSFRVAKGTAVHQLVIGQVTFDISGLDER